MSYLQPVIINGQIVQEGDCVVFEDDSGNRTLIPMNVFQETQFSSLMQSRSSPVPTAPNITSSPDPNLQSSLPEPFLDDTELDVGRFWKSSVGEMDATEALISVIFSTTVLQKLEDKTTPKKGVYEDVGDRLREMGYSLPWNRTVTGEKVSQKYRNLVKRFKDYIDKVNKTGAAPPKSVPKYFDLLHPHLSKRHDILPQNILDSFSSSPVPSPTSPLISPTESASFSFPPTQISLIPTCSSLPQFPLSDFSPQVTSFFSNYKFPTLSASSDLSRSSSPLPSTIPSRTSSPLPSSLPFRTSSPIPSSIPSQTASSTSASYSSSSHQTSLSLTSSIPSTSAAPDPTSRHHLVKSKLKPEKKQMKQVSSFFEEFRKEEAERRKAELEAYKEASEKERKQREEFLGLFRSFVYQSSKNKRKRRREDVSSDSD